MSHYKPAELDDVSSAFGSILDDIGDIATSAWDKTKGVVHDVGHVLEGVPGGNLIVDAANQGAQWTQDIANTDTGNIVLRAMATALYGPLANQLGLAWFGPQIASVVWALPGLFRGEDFLKAWTVEFTYRAGKTAEVIGGEAAEKAFAAAGPTIQVLLDKAMKQYPGLSMADALNRLNITPEQLAGELGIRVDIAALAIEYAKGRMGFYKMSDYDPATGGKILSPYASITTDTRPVAKLGKASGAALYNQLVTQKVSNVSAEQRKILTSVVGKPTAALMVAGVKLVSTSKAPVVQKAIIEARAINSDGNVIVTEEVVDPSSVNPQPSAKGVTPAGGIGAVGGAAAGFAVAGPVGALFGAIIGFVGGSAISK